MHLPYLLRRQMYLESVILVSLPFIKKRMQKNPFFTMVNNEKEKPTESKTSSIKAAPKTGTDKKSVKFDDAKTMIHKYSDKSAEFLETGKLKVKTSIYTDIFMLVCCLLLIVIFSIANAPQDLPDQDPPKIKKKRSKSGKILVKVPPPPIDYSKNPNCGLVLSMSSIPRQGYGIFAIKNFTKGDVLVSQTDLSEVSWRKFLDL